MPSLKLGLQEGANSPWESINPAKSQVSQLRANCPSRESILPAESQFSQPRVNSPSWEPILPADGQVSQLRANSAGRESNLSAESQFTQLKAYSLTVHIVPPSTLILLSLQGEKAAKELGSYVVTVKAEYLLIVTLHYLANEDPERVQKEYEDFNR